MTMFRLAAAATACFLLSVDAMAADLHVPRPAPVAPVFMKQRDWSGAYLGVHGGLEADGFRSREAPGVPALNFAGKKSTKSLGGGNAGVQAGYNFQSGNIVYGVEAEASLLSLNKKKSPANLQAQANTRYTLRGRLGYSFGTTLVYATAGAAIAPMRFTSPAAGTVAGGRKSETRLGPTIGLGVEHMLSETISLKGELDYAAFGKQKLQFPAGRTSVTSGEMSAKLGLNYHF